MLHTTETCVTGAQAPGGQTSSTVISFAQKTFANGNLTSKLHVIELGAPPGAHMSPQANPPQASLALLSLLANLSAWRDPEARRCI